MVIDIHHEGRDCCSKSARVSRRMVGKGKIAVGFFGMVVGVRVFGARGVKAGYFCREWGLICRGVMVM